MALSVDFSIDEELTRALGEMKHEDKFRAVIAIIENERIKMADRPIIRTDELANDMATVRSRIEAAKLEACFVIIRLDFESTKPFNLILLTPEGIKPRTRMIYASSAAHLRNQSGLTMASGDTHATALLELTPALFGGKDDKGRAEVMNESERAAEKIKAMPIAPMTMAMPGVQCPLLPAAIEAIEMFVRAGSEGEGDAEAEGEKKVGAALFTVAAAGIDSPTTLPTGCSMADIIAQLPNDAPRYVLCRYDGKVVMAYVVPAETKIKERMPYASSKASFVAQASAKGLNIDRKVETDDPKGLEGAIKEALSGATVPDAAPIAPVSLLRKGPRMLI